MNRSSTSRRVLPSLNHPNDKELIRRRQRFTLSKSKLGRIIDIASFMGGFSVVAMAELQIPDPPNDNEWLLIAFTITTVTLASMCGYIIMFTAWILPHLRADEEMDFVLIETKLVKQFNRHRLFKLEKKMRYFIQISWILASIGSVFLFTIDVILVFWIKFSHKKVAVYSATGILGPMLLIFLFFGLLFRKKLMKSSTFESVEDDEDEDDDDNLNETENFSFENERYLNILPDRRPSDAISIGKYVSSLHHVLKIV